MDTTLQPQDIWWCLDHHSDIMFTTTTGERMMGEITFYLDSCTYHCENRVQTIELHGICYIYIGVSSSRLCRLLLALSGAKWSTDVSLNLRSDEQNWWQCNISRHISSKKRKCQIKRVTYQCIPLCWCA